MNVVDDYLAYCLPLAGSPRYHLFSILTTIAALLERRVWVDRGRLGIIFPNMYTILVGPPAAGKSTAASIAVKLFKQVKGIPPHQRDPRLGPTKITQAALYKELKDAERELRLSGDKVYKQSPLFIYASELAINMSDFGGGTLTNELIDFYDSKGMNEYVEKRIVSEQLNRIENPSLSLLGCTTDKFLQSAANDKLITSGLSSRIVFVVETEKVLKNRNHVEPDRTAIYQLHDALTHIYNMRGPMSLDPSAHAAFVAIADASDDSCYSSTSELLQNYFGRKADHVTKIAMVLAAAERRYNIFAADIEKATKILEGVEPFMIKAFGTRSIEKDSDLSAQVLSVMPLEPEWITEGDLIATLNDSGKFIPSNGALSSTLKSFEVGGMANVRRLGTLTQWQKIRK